MKFMASILFLAAFCFLAATPVWANNCNYNDNCIVNGGFETGGFTGWTLSGNTGPGITDVININNGPYTHDGAYGARLGPVGSDGYLTQTFDGNTLSFQFRDDPSYWGLDDVDVELNSSCGVNCYSLSFWLFSNGYIPNDFTVLWNGNNVGPSLVNSGSFPFTEYAGNLPAGPVSAIPEPTSLLLLGTGVAAVCLATWRKRSLFSLGIPLRPDYASR